MTTRETARLVYRSLSDNGVALMNVMSAAYGTKGRFLRAGLATYRSVFPRGEFFKLNDDPESVGNVIIVAFENPAEPQWTSNDPAIAAHLSPLDTADSNGCSNPYRRLCPRGSLYDEMVLLMLVFRDANSERQGDKRIEKK